MADYPEDGWSVLVLRVWFEDSPGNLRARIVMTVGGAKPTATVFARRDDVVDAVGIWIDSLVAEAGQRSDRG